MRKQALIIAGTNKSGTTSLFRYLSDHPQICPSRTKELQFFLRADPNLQDYRNQFPDKPGTTIALEASPQYLDDGPQVIQRISELLPHTKLIFVLREPVARLRSFFKSYESRASDLVKGYNFHSFVKDALSVGSDANVEFQRELNRGCYADHLNHWLATFKPSQIHILFFDRLQQDSKASVQDICRFAGLDPYIYKDYEFAIENKTRQYRFSGFHKIAHRLNRSLEPFFNRHRSIKKVIRQIYTSLNENKGPNSDSGNEEQARVFYRPHNKKLRDLVETQFPEIALPDWLGR